MCNERYRIDDSRNVIESFAHDLKKMPLKRSELSADGFLPLLAASKPEATLAVHT